MAVKATKTSRLCSTLANMRRVGVALSGSSVPITVTVDSVVLGTLNPGSYGGVVTVAANNPLNGTASINLSLV